MNLFENVSGRNKYAQSTVPPGFYVYLYRDLDGTPIYVGKGKGGRYKQHFQNSTNSRIGNKLRKLKSSGHTLMPSFFECESEELAFLVEEEMISLYGRECVNEGTLYNISSGGEGSSGFKLSDEVKASISKRRRGVPTLVKGQFKHSKETIERLKRPRSEEQKRNMRVPHKAREPVLHTEDAKNKLREIALNRPKVKCPHCDKIGSSNTMKQWHFDNCKLK